MIQTQRPHLSVATSTHQGRSGKSNEDRLGVASFRRASGESVLFAVVSDGIGGHRAGEVAAELTVKHMVKQVGASAGEDPNRIMETAIHSASQAILQRAASHPDQAGMGSTCACVWLDGERLYTAHVGDSRIYLVRGGMLVRTTVDHTWIQEAIEKGVIRPEQARHHPNAHVLRRYLGSPEPPQVDTRLYLAAGESDEQAISNQGLHFGPQDLLLVCSDGLTDLVDDDKILDVLMSSSKLRSSADALVQTANENGGYDNITVVLIGTVPSSQSVNEKRGFLQNILRV